MQSMTGKSRIGGGASALTSHSKGFTLAEVLITLAIIGVVAVLTIPTLMANYQQRGWNTAATVFERKLEESLKVMNTQGTLAGYKTTEAFVNELQKHLKITKVCKNDDILSCFEDTVMFGAGEAEPEEVEIKTVKTAKNFGQDKWDTNVLGLQLANGTSALIAYNPECKQDPYSNQISGLSCIAILYDTSGYAKPNTSGKDLNAINVKSLGKACAFEIGETCYSAPFKPTPLTKAECEAIKGDLGISECYYDNDYWAGAVETCKGVQNLPTDAHLIEIAKYLYPSLRTIYTTGTTACPNNYNCRDSEKVLSLGFTNISYSGKFYIWGGAQKYSTTAYYSTFDSNKTYREYGYRYNQNVHAVCIVD